MPPNEANSPTGETANPRDKSYKFSDSGGLYLEVTTSGSRYWRLKYRYTGGKIIPDNRHDITIRLMEHICDNPHQQTYEGRLFSIRYFQKGTGHITFKRLDRVEKMNDIVAKHYPGTLPAR
ncbi:DUF4942 domain-containing protein [Enterobacteriaceae bacterium BIT-l23]|nr:DUF4942 domain-containing protein [Enterobacteriaceae bacterium BIT-l23]